MLKTLVGALITLGASGLVAVEVPGWVAQTQAADPAELIGPKLKAARWIHHARAPGYSEGPTWRAGEVYFCSGSLLQVTRDGRVSRYLDINPAGTVLRGDGRLLICDNKHKAILELSLDGALKVFADQFEGKPLNSLNDLTLDARGNVYWTDPAGSSAAKPVGKVFRLRPDGKVTQIAGGLAFPNGIEVDPKNRFLYLIESQSKKILRYDLPSDDEPLGRSELFFDLGGSGGDGCAFDAAGNLWVADFHRPETKHGRITVLSPEAKVLGTLDVPAEVVSNIAFGGTDHDEIFCTTGNPPGVFRAKVGVQGFRGHPGVPMKSVRDVAIAPEEPASPVHPRRFGLPGGVGPTRGWYIWHAFDRKTWTAAVSHEGTGERYEVQVLPWATTYRHLVYGAHPDELLPGERVNLFFAPSEKHKRGYLVHFQDELCQMKGHGHRWEVRSVAADGMQFTARVLAGDKPLDDKTLTFKLDAGCRHWRKGSQTVDSRLEAGNELFFTWLYRKGERMVLLTADDSSLESLKKIEQAAVGKRLGADGLAGHLEAVDNMDVRLLLFATYWAQASQLHEKQAVRLRGTGAGFEPAGESIAAQIVSRKNLGTYGSGATEMVLRLERSQDVKAVQAWVGKGVVKLHAGP